MTRRQRRAMFVVAALAAAGVVVALLIQVFQTNLMYFRTPSEVAEGLVPEGARFRLGGLVVTGSVEREPGSLAVAFRLADCEQDVRVQYEGILPDLFREGQGIVVTGRLEPGRVVQADEVLAKHDENYIPPELADKLVTETGHDCAPFKSMSES